MTNAKYRKENVKWKPAASGGVQGSDTAGWLQTVASLNCRGPNGVSN